jgi:hypothetical protein
VRCGTVMQGVGESARRRVGGGLVRVEDCTKLEGKQIDLVGALPLALNRERKVMMKSAVNRHLDS